MRYLSLLLLLTACDVAVVEMTPEQCRAYGVAVHDNDVITGTVIGSRFGTLADMQRECGFDGAAGCTRAHGVEPPSWPSATGEYDVWYSERQCIPFHEFCHAQYQRKGHTTSYIVRSLQGDKLAACP